MIVRDAKVARSAGDVLSTGSLDRFGELDVPAASVQ